MNKIGYRPMPVLLRAEPSDARWTSYSARFLRVFATLAVFALCGVIAIFLIGFSALPPRTLETKGPVEVPVLSATSLSPAAVPSLDQGVGVRLPDTNQVLRGTFAEDHSIVDQPPTTAPARNPDSAPAQVSHPEASVSDGELLKRERPEDAPINRDRYLSETVRKNLERARREAERKRSRLEDTYRKHAISSDAYKKGEEQYRTEIEKYRVGINAHIEPKN